MERLETVPLKNTLITFGGDRKAVHATEGIRSAEFFVASGTGRGRREVGIMSHEFFNADSSNVGPLLHNLFLHENQRLFRSHQKIILTLGCLSPYPQSAKSMILVLRVSSGSSESESWGPNEGRTSSSSLSSSAPSAAESPWSG